LIFFKYLSAILTPGPGSVFRMLIQIQLQQL